MVVGAALAVALFAALGFTGGAWDSRSARPDSGLAAPAGEQRLEVPISAMLILSLDTKSAANGRLVGTLIGAGAGLLAGLILAPSREQPAAEDIELTRLSAANDEPSGR